MTSPEVDRPDPSPITLSNQDIDKWLAERMRAAQKVLEAQLRARDEDGEFNPKQFAYARYQLSAFCKLAELFNGVFAEPPLLDRFEDPEAEFYRIIQAEGYLPRPKISEEETG